MTITDSGESLRTPNEAVHWTALRTENKRGREREDLFPSQTFSVQYVARFSTYTFNRRRRIFLPLLFSNPFYFLFVLAVVRLWTMWTLDWSVLVPGCCCCCGTRTHAAGLRELGLRRLRQQCS